MKKTPSSKLDVSGNINHSQKQFNNHTNTRSQVYTLEIPSGMDSDLKRSIIIWIGIFSIVIVTIMILWQKNLLTFSQKMVDYELVSNTKQKSLPVKIETTTKTKSFFAKNNFSNLSTFQKKTHSIILGKTNSLDILDTIVKYPELIKNQKVKIVKEIPINRHLKVQKIFLENNTIGSCFWIQNKNKIITSKQNKNMHGSANKTNEKFDFVYIENCNSKGLIEDIVRKLK